MNYIKASNFVNQDIYALFFKSYFTLLQPQYKKQEDDLVDFQFNPVSSAIELEELDENLSDKAYAKEVVGYLNKIYCNLLKVICFLMIFR